MFIAGLFKTAFDAVRDPEREFTERVFLILTAMSEFAGFTALIGDIVTKENPYEIAVIISMLFFVPLVTFTCLHFNALWLATRIIVIGLVFVFLPTIFFFGGGLKGGGVYWIIFAFMYAGLVLRDNWRKIIFVFLAILTFVCFLSAYHHPVWVYQHSVEMYYVDTFISLMLVGVLCYVMTWSQGRLFIEENERAKKEAERAEELSRAQNRFFSNMSHEIRTPINSILGFNELILRDNSASDDIVRDASGIQGSGKMLLALINDILDFSKIEAGSMDIVSVDYRVGDMLSEIVNMMWFRAQDKGLGFEVSVDPMVPSGLLGDEVRIKQIMINLLNNAVKYTASGHVEFRVESREADEENIELVMSVTDTGMGIKKEDIPYLFDAFKRVDEDKNRHIEGTGLGLSIVKQLVELMDGTVSVNSVYGEGSTFTVTVKQRVTDRSNVGELNIHSQQIVKRSAYESSFLAPEVRILIVDDNEMNLEVERRLLLDTDMGIDTAMSGKEALEKSLKVHYDLIFMDHLMPEMDGIECLEALRMQTGGLNKNTPVIILTANAGSENRDLYVKSGFDGYLIKPVSGAAMEETLIRHISSEKIIQRSVMMGESSEIHTADRYAEKAPVIITSSSMCDLPDAVVKKYGIPIIPFRIKTEDGIFRDGVHIDAFELVSYMGSGKEAASSPPEESEYTEFFADALKKAHHVIHISMTSSMSRDYNIASEAAKAFDNVSVVNSECLSSAAGILVLIAYKLSKQGLPAEEIISEIEYAKHRLKCSFVIDTTEYMSKKGLVAPWISSIARSLNIHPAIYFDKDRAGIGGMWLGSTKRAYRKYIGRALPPDTIPDSDIVFITYVDIPKDTLDWIKEEITRNAFFKHVVFQQASAAISSNCGPGALGILYFLKSNKAYNISALMDKAENTETTEAGESYTPPENIEVSADEEKTYPEIEGIDIKTGIENSGSERSFRSVLEIFYNTIFDRYSELENCYAAEDWDNYTVKIHALKSSSRLVGALALGDRAERLEKAGKEKDVEYIRENHGSVMEDYLNFRGILKNVIETPDKPMADIYTMEGIYEDLLDAAKMCDGDRVKTIMVEIGEFTIPDSEAEKFGLISEKAEILDFDGIKEALL